MPWQDAVQDAPGGCRILIDLVPGAKDTVFPDGFDAWRTRLRARVTAPARDGRANAALLAAVATRLDLPVGALRLEAGATARRKTVHAAAPRGTVVARLLPSMEDA